MSKLFAIELKAPQFPTTERVATLEGIMAEVQELFTKGVDHEQARRVDCALIAAGLQPQAVFGAFATAMCVLIDAMLAAQERTP